MSSNLKPCPFCGGEAEFYEFTCFWVSCKDCWCETFTYDTKQEAVEAWNRRVNN